MGSKVNPLDLLHDKSYQQQEHDRIIRALLTFETDGVDVEKLNLVIKKIYTNNPALNSILIANADGSEEWKERGNNFTSLLLVYSDFRDFYNEYVDEHDELKQPPIVILYCLNSLGFKVNNAFMDGFALKHFIALFLDEYNHIDDPGFISSYYKAQSRSFQEFLNAIPANNKKIGILDKFKQDPVMHKLDNYGFNNQVLPFAKVKDATKLPAPWINYETLDENYTNGLKNLAKKHKTTIDNIVTTAYIRAIAKTINSFDVAINVGRYYNARNETSNIYRSYSNLHVVLPNVATVKPKSYFNETLATINSVDALIQSEHIVAKQLTIGVNKFLNVPTNYFQICHYGEFDSSIFKVQDDALLYIFFTPAIRNAPYHAINTLVYNGMLFAGTANFCPLEDNEMTRKLLARFFIELKEYVDSNLKINPELANDKNAIREFYLKADVTYTKNINSFKNTQAVITPVANIATPQVVRQKINEQKPIKQHFKMAKNDVLSKIGINPNSVLDDEPVNAPDVVDDVIPENEPSATPTTNEVKPISTPSTTATTQTTNDNSPTPAASSVVVTHPDQHSEFRKHVDEIALVGDELIGEINKALDIDPKHPQSIAEIQKHKNYPPVAAAIEKVTSEAESYVQTGVHKPIPASPLHQHHPVYQRIVAVGKGILHKIAGGLRMIYGQNKKHVANPNNKQTVVHPEHKKTFLAHLREKIHHVNHRAHKSIGNTNPVKQQPALTNQFANSKHEPILKADPLPPPVINSKPINSAEPVVANTFAQSTPPTPAAVENNAHDINSSNGISQLKQTVASKLDVPQATNQNYRTPPKVDDLINATDVQINPDHFVGHKINIAIKSTIIDGAYPNPFDNKIGDNIVIHVDEPVYKNPLPPEPETVPAEVAPIKDKPTVLEVKFDHVDENGKTDFIPTTVAHEVKEENQLVNHHAKAKLETKSTTTDSSKHAIDITKHLPKEWDEEQKALAVKYESFTGNKLYPVNDDPQRVKYLVKGSERTFQKRTWDDIKKYVEYKTKETSTKTA